MYIVLIICIYIFTLFTLYEKNLSMTLDVSFSFKTDLSCYILLGGTVYVASKFTKSIKSGRS